MKVKMLKTAYHDTLGRLNPGDTADISEELAEEWEEQGAADREYETKVIVEKTPKRKK